MVGLLGSFFPSLLLPLPFICLLFYFTFGFVGEGDDGGCLFEFEIFWLLGSNMRTTHVEMIISFDLIIDRDRPYCGPQLWI